MGKRIYTQMDLDNLRKYYIKTQLDDDVVIVTTRTNNPTYLKQERSDKLQGAVVVLRKGPFRFVLLRDVAVMSLQAGRDPLEMMMRLYNYSAYAKKPVSVRRLDETLDVLRVLLREPATTYEHILHAQGSLRGKE